MASTTFLKLADDPKFRGGCMIVGHVGWIELLHFTWGWHGAHDGGTPRSRSESHEVVVGTTEVVGSTALMRAAVDGTEFPMVLVDMVPATGATMRFELRKVMVSSLSTSSSRDEKPITNAVLLTERISIATLGTPATAAR